jgi:hypothetical protein
MKHFDFTVPPAVALWKEEKLATLSQIFFPKQEVFAEFSLSARAPLVSLAWPNPTS